MNPFPQGQPTFIIVHHSAGPIGQTVEEIKKEHTSPSPNDPTKPWEDIGYHVVIEYPTINHSKLGDIIKPGRSEKFIGAQCLNFNSKSLGVCVVGDWRSLMPHNLQMGALIAQLSKWMEEYKIPIDNILCHKDKFQTACPGDSLYNEVKNIKTMLYSLHKGTA